MSHPVPVKKDKPKSLAVKKLKAAGTQERWDTPGCCDLAAQMVQVFWNGDCWVIHVDTGGGEPSFEQQVFFCPFCGTKLDDEMQAYKHP